MDILISACLKECACRYDGKDNFIEDFFHKHKDINFIKICPEVEAGMPIPRDPCEIRDGKVIDIKGNDQTFYFKKGGKLALKKALDYNIEVALLKAKSPSCGVGHIYDGSFSKTLIPGNGIAAKLLKDAHIKVFTEKDLDLFEKYIKNFS